MASKAPLFSPSPRSWQPAVPWLPRRPSSASSSSPASCPATPAPSSTSPLLRHFQTRTWSCGAAATWWPAPRRARTGRSRWRQTCQRAGGVVGACELVVDTPLVKCDGKLPAAGALVSSLRGPLTRLLSGIFQLAPAGFSFRMS
uniref:Uncharacterized protein n=1 Tax=Aegilops tauschii TaxID=37682 RepID=N1R0L7_AEGTA